MARSAFILGYGQIGRALAKSLEAAGWSVTIGVRTAIGDRHRNFVAIDRDKEGQLAHALKPGFDAVIDTVAFDEGHAAQWAALQGGFGKLAVISSISVYADSLGRTLDEAQQNGPPDFGGVIAESNRRIAPGPATYSTRKVALEDAVAALAVPTAIVRPGAVYGIGSRSPREWWFIEKVLAGHTGIPVAWNGASRFHPVAATNLAEIVRMAIEAPGSHVLNAADPACPTVLELGRTILDAMGSTARLEPFAGPPQGLVGYTPWSIPHPMIVATDAAERLGYRPVSKYGDDAEELCRDLVDRARKFGWKVAFPGLSAYPEGFFLN